MDGISPHFFTELFRLIRLLGWENPIKAESWKNPAELFGIWEAE
jgi:hypothetical protein